MLAALEVPGVVVTTFNFLVASLLDASPLIIRSAHSAVLVTTKLSLMSILPLNTLDNCVFSTVILSLMMISSNTGRKFAVSPTIDNVGVSSDASSPVTADILVLPMNRSPLLLSPESVSYTHLTLPTIYSV